MIILLLCCSFYLVLFVLLLSPPLLFWFENNCVWDKLRVATASDQCFFMPSFFLRAHVPLGYFLLELKDFVENEIIDEAMVNVYFWSEE
jgi:hypothetical protein